MADYGRAISLSQGRDLSHTSDDDESEQHSPRSIPTLSGSACGAGGGGGGGGSSSAKSKKLEMGSAGEISTKKPRGRPPGSKNKPKPPIVITKDSESGMKAVVLEISAGSDVVETLVHFARTRHVGITVLSGSGSVSNVTLRHPLTSVSHAPSLMSLHGPFALLSLSGSFMEYSSTTCSSTTPSSKLAGAAAAASSFGICLAGAQGQVFGGIVGGKIIAASVVVVVAATFSNPAFHRLPTGTGGGGDRGDETEDDGEAEQHHHQETKHRCIVGNQHHIESSNISSGSTVAAAMSMSVNYTSVASPTPINCQITPDHHVMPWGPPSRPPY